MGEPLVLSLDFVPFRRDVHFLDARPAPIRPLLERLSSIQDKRRWGYAFRYGQLEIPAADFVVIAEAMLGQVPCWS